MSSLRLQLKCHQMINDIPANILNTNVAPLLHIFGGIKTVLINSLNDMASDNLTNLLNTLTNIKSTQIIINDTNSNESDTDMSTTQPMTISKLPKQLLLKTSEYLQISEIKSLAITCIDIALACSSELNKIDIKLVTYNDFILNDKLMMEQKQFDEFPRIIRVNKYETVLTTLYKLFKTDNFYYGNWNCGDSAFTNDPFPICDMNYNESSKNLCNIDKKHLQIYGFNFELYVKPLYNYIDTNGLESDYLIMLKYFDVKRQKLYTLDIFRIDYIENIEHFYLLEYIRNNLLHKYPVILDDIIKNQHSMMDINKELIHFYSQNGLLPSDIKREFIDGRTNIDNVFVIIFQLNVLNDNINNFDGIEKIKIWKKELDKINVPLCVDVRQFWLYHYRVYQMKKQMNLL